MVAIPRNSDTVLRYSALRVRRVQFDARKSSLVRATYTIETLYSNKSSRPTLTCTLLPPLEKTSREDCFFQGKNVEKLFREEVIYDYSVIVREEKRNPTPLSFQREQPETSSVLDDDKVFSYVLSQTITTCLSRTLVSCCFQEWRDTCTSLFVPSMAATSKPLVHSR